VDGCNVILHWPSTAASFTQANRGGFFAALDDQVDVVPGRPSQITGLFSVRGDPSITIVLPLAQIAPTDRASTSRALWSLEEGLAPHLDESGAEAVIGRIQTCVSEAAGNIHDHSRATVPGVIAAQRYVTEVGMFFRLVVCDVGLGLIQTLRNAGAVDGMSDEEVLVKALQDGLTSRENGDGGGGLIACAAKAARYRGAFRVRTSGIDARFVTGVGHFELKQVNKRPFFQGTQLVFDLRLDSGSAKSNLVHCEW
jgi:hypothetical protein